MNLQRPTQTELDCMNPAEKDALILQLFDALEKWHSSTRAGSRVGGKLHWLPVATSERAVYDTTHAKRGREAMEPAPVTSLLERYDQQVGRGLTLFPVKPPDPDDKRRTKQHPATNLLCRLRDFKTEVWRFLTD